MCAYSENTASYFLPKSMTSSADDEEEEEEPEEEEEDEETQPPPPPKKTKRKPAAKAPKPPVVPTTGQAPVANKKKDKGKKAKADASQPPAAEPSGKSVPKPSGKGKGKGKAGPRNASPGPSAGPTEAAPESAPTSRKFAITIPPRPLPNVHSALPASTNAAPATRPPSPTSAPPSSRAPTPAPQFPDIPTEAEIDGMISHARGTLTKRLKKRLTKAQGAELQAINAALTYLESKKKVRTPKAAPKKTPKTFKSAEVVDTEDDTPRAGPSFSGVGETARRLKQDAQAAAAAAAAPPEPADGEEDAFDDALSLDPLTPTSEPMDVDPEEPTETRPQRSPQPAHPEQPNPKRRRGVSCRPSGA